MPCRFSALSQTYDRYLRNVLSCAAEIATAVTKALQATLMLMRLP